jgi:hypothetical protein
MSDTTLAPPSARQAFQARLWRWLKTPWTVTVLALVAVAVRDPGQWVALVDFASGAFLRTLPYILFAVLLLAYLRATGAERLVGAAFRGREYRMILLAALVGGLAPFCSCQVIPFIAGLLALGAPLSAVMAFWLASPLVDPGNTLITAAALGWNFAVAKAVAAVGLGLAGGMVVAGLSRAGLFADVLKVQPKKSCCSKADPLDGKPQWRFWQEPGRRAEFSETFWQMALFLAQWLILAYVLEAILVFYVPAELVAGLVGGEGLMPIIVSALVGMPAYLNSYVAPPMLAGLIEQGMSQGAAMAFLVAGAVSSIPAMAAVWSLVKPRVFAAYLGLGVGGAIISGAIFQLVIGGG